ncbi:hypothetical protein GE061_010730 [Apolygus lucorum]|uniref:Uncharacterized protein n=1 Tax=Apolygus lucorum TaxID=248454 RepID=A0A6A4K2J4_APOLU|nr:hypothetical protein GE061_010730 [Apolygus lucorum]
MLIPSRKVLLVLAVACFVEIFGIQTSIALLKTEDCLENNNPNKPTTVNVNHTRHLVLHKRQLGEPTVAYYDFLVNEFSFKVWAVFEMVTIALLFYSTFAAIYYARWTYLRTEPTEDDLFLRRSHERLMRALQNPP